MKIEGNPPAVISFDPTQIYNNAEDGALGDTVYLNDGRVFRYGLAGASAIGPGKVATSPAPIANHQAMATTVSAIGATIVNVTPGATAGAANLYAEGYLLVTTGTGPGQTFKVKSHPAIVSSTAFNVTLFDPIVTALDATSVTSLIHNGYASVITGTSQTVRPVGVPLVSVTAAYYGWFQTKGIASVLVNGTPAAGSLVVLSGTTAGAVDVANATYATALATMSVGKILVTGISTQYQAVFLDIG